MKHLRLALAVALLTFGAAAHAATFNLFQPASGILVGNPNTYVTTAADSADVIALWSGTCDSTTYLRADGSCVAPITGAAGSDGQVQYNASGSFAGDSGLTYDSSTDTLTIAGGIDVPAITTSGVLAITATDVTVNGDGVCLSDGTNCPAGGGDATLAGNQTFTGQNTFSNLVTFNRPTGATALFTSNQPLLTITEADASADNRIWRFTAQNENLLIQTQNDANSVISTALQIDRTGTAVDSVTLGAPLMFGSGSVCGSSASGACLPNGVAIRGLTTGASGRHLLSLWTDDIFYLGAPNLPMVIDASTLTINSAATFVNPVRFETASNFQRLVETDAPANEGEWNWAGANGDLQLQTRADGGGAGSVVLNVARTGTTVDAITLGAPTIIQNSSPTLDIYDDDAVANRRRIRLQTGSSSFNISAVSDDGSTVNPFISLSTSGTASPATLNLQATNVQVNGSPVCTANGANCPAASVALAGGTFVTSGSSCGLTNSTGRMSSCTRAGTGLYNMTFSPSMGSNVTCVVSNQFAGGAVNPSFGYVAVSSGTAAQLRTFIQNPPGSAAAAFDGGIFYVICHGT